MEYHLKYPLIKSNKGLSAFRSGKGPEDKNLESKVSVTGIILVIIYFLTFIYIYYSSRNKLSRTNFTLSEAFQFSEKKISTVLLVILVLFIILTFLDKKLITDTSSNVKKLLVIISFGILLFFMLLFFIPPTHTQMKNHIVVAFLLLLFMIVSSCIYYYLYNEVYVNENLLEDMSYITYVLSSLVLIMFILFMIKIYKYDNSKIQIGTSIGIGICEITIIILYGTILSILSTLPPLIDFDFICSAKLR